MATATAAIMAFGAIQGMSNASKLRRDAKRQANQALKDREEQQAKVDQEVANYKAMKFTNPFADMENPFEDLTVATGAAQFQAEQGAQQRADILQGLRGAAGTSGIAGLAQTLASQGALQARSISADLQKQERENAILAAKGTSALDMAEAKGDIMVQEAISGQQATILGIQYGQAAGASKNYQQQLLNQMQANQAAAEMQQSSMMSLANVFAG